MVSFKLKEYNTETEFDFKNHLNFCKPMLCLDTFDGQMVVLIVTDDGYVRFSAGEPIGYGSVEYLINSNSYRFVRFLTKDESVTFTGTENGE